MKQSPISRNSAAFEKEAGNCYLVHEHLIFSDAEFLGHSRDGLSPYHVISLVSGSGGFKARAVLRIHWAVQEGQAYPDQTNASSQALGYTGMEPHQELGALVSMMMGCRVKVSPMSRAYKPNGDPAGIDIRHHDTPLWLSANHIFGPVIPWAKERKFIHLDQLEALRLIHGVNATQLPEIIKAARLFSDALWVCESDPQLAWVLLVSALETAASSEIKKVKSQQAFERAFPDEAKELEAKLDPNSYLHVAEKFGLTQKAGEKLLRFCDKFHPEAPQEVLRPPAAGRVDWSRAGWKHILGIVYKHRSNYLHSGTPFPFPLLNPPLELSVENPESGETSKVLSECIGGAAQWLGARFVKEDLPVNLNTFSSFVHGVLTRWLGSHLQGGK